VAGQRCCAFNVVFVPGFQTKGFADLYRRGTNPSLYAGCAHFPPSFGPPLVPLFARLVKETSARVHALRGKFFTLLVPAVRPLANIGNASRSMNKDSELIVRGVFDLGVRRKPQAFAADAVSLWILNPNMLIVNELNLYNAKSR
jgi:hypothetical protein